MSEIGTYDFAALADFIQHRMRMSHVYQPVMLIQLLKNGGVASTEEIARALLAQDQSQIEYYQAITRDMVGAVLRRRGLVSKEGKVYRLIGWEKLRGDETQELIDLCQRRLESYLAKRGDRIFEHRRKSAGYVSGTLRYEVLKRAGFHCELCGISAENKALEVDHIVPRNHEGTDDLSNLQALCYSCNAMKRDRDATDFRAVRASYVHRADGCTFCAIPSERVVEENELACAIRDGFPVTPGHTLIIPKRHAPDYFSLHQSEINACNGLLKLMRGKILSDDAAVTGFNIGVNNGEDAGQTIFHCHIHLIPRRKGDVERPRGGVRHLIPGKGEY
jgi:diadenosine tetraphosphate (Ap4A) HIT family hydrolase/5-methylcytosine-specific restriction endonuclease McrA